MLFFQHNWPLRLLQHANHKACLTAVSPGCKLSVSRWQPDRKPADHPACDITTFSAIHSTFFLVTTLEFWNQAPRLDGFTQYQFNQSHICYTVYASFMVQRDWGTSISVDMREYCCRLTSSTLTVVNISLQGHWRGHRLKSLLALHNKPVRVVLFPGVCSQNAAPAAQRQTKRVLSRDTQCDTFSLNVLRLFIHTVGNF